jgi:hypothetical protein
MEFKMGIFFKLYFRLPDSEDKEVFNKSDSEKRHKSTSHIEIHAQVSFFFNKTKINYTAQQIMNKFWSFEKKWSSS